MKFKTNTCTRMLLNVAVVSTICCFVTSDVLTNTTESNKRPDLENVEVETKLGTIVGAGKELKRNDQFAGDIFNFFDVPYALAPVGDLSFKKPLPVGNWTGIKDARQMTSMCVQSVSFQGSVLNNKESEDCLNMDIYVPRVVTKGRNKAVLIWVHSSGFIFGGKHYINADWISLVGDVIVVVPNYRLGIFGFLSTGDKESPGNFGIWDIQLATKWVKENIESFGGDPQRITVGAGSGSEGIVSIMSTYPKNMGLFQRAIAMGISPTQKWTIVRDPLLLTLTFVNMTGCGNYSRETFDSRIAMNCVRNLSTETIKKTTSLILQSASLMVDPTQLFLKSVLGPVIDGDILKTELSSSDTASKEYEMFRSLDYLSGNVDDEGSVVAQIITPHIIDKYNITIQDGIPEAFLCGELAPTISKSFYQNRPDVTSAICNRYTVIAQSSVKFSIQSQAIVNGFGDFMYVAPVVEALRLHSKGNDVTSTYQYLVTKSQSDGSGFTWLKGARHGLDMHYFLDVLPNEWSYSQEDLDFTKTFVTYITNFAKYGNPNDKQSTTDTWKPFSSPDSEHYLKIQHVVTTETNLYRGRMEFWLDTIPELMKKHLTIAPSIGQKTNQPTKTYSISTASNVLSTSQKTTVPFVGVQGIKRNDQGLLSTTTHQPELFGNVMSSGQPETVDKPKKPTKKITNNSGTRARTDVVVFIMNILVVILSLLMI